MRLTFAEYLFDYASERTRNAGLALIETELAKFSDPSMQQSVREKIGLLKEGKRDLYY